MSKQLPPLPEYNAMHRDGYLYRMAVLQAQHNPNMALDGSPWIPSSSAKPNRADVWHTQIVWVYMEGGQDGQDGAFQYGIGTYKRHTRKWETVPVFQKRKIEITQDTVRAWKPIHDPHGCALFIPHALLEEDGSERPVRHWLTAARELLSSLFVDVETWD